MAIGKSFEVREKNESLYTIFKGRIFPAFVKNKHNLCINSYVISIPIKLN